jgi:hypothetical protein
LYYYKGGRQGNSICTNWRNNVNEKEYFEKSITIKTISMRDILSKYSKVKELWLNCEGSEIPIIMNTPLELLGKCEYIMCEFHRFSSFLNISEGDVLKCIEKLSPLFTCKLIENFHPCYEMFRK